jgi:predicted dehydrogenase
VDVRLAADGHHGASLVLPASVLVVGAGYAGNRFIKAIHHLEREHGEVRLGGIVDTDTSRLRPWSAQGVPVFSVLPSALSCVRPDVVVVAVNEEAHVGVLRTLALSGSRFILCEKPLTRTVAEAEALHGPLCHSVLSLNLVERFSDIVSAAQRWLAATGAIDVIRVEFHWGKHRIADPRPTIGVASELIHPIDLVHVLFTPGRLRDVSGFGVDSNLSCNGPVCMDSIHFSARAEAGYTLLGHASFTWPRRVRNLSSLARDARGRLYRLILTFDTPHWDCDEFIVEELHQRSGQYRCLERLVTSLDAVPADVRGIGKVIRFVRASISHWVGGTQAPLLVDLDAAIGLQRIVERVCGEVECLGTLGNSFFRKSTEMA